jgi:arabinogalactan oligomer/maltooligosaccharide transport system permease protein
MLPDLGHFAGKRSVPAPLRGGGHVTPREHLHFWAYALLCACFFLAGGCAERQERTVVTLWHQMVPAEREKLHAEIERFEALHPEVVVRALYKENEELRSGFEAAALAGAGPELVFGPSDVMGPYQTMGILQDMSPWFPDSLRQEFVAGGLVYLPSRDDPDRLQLLQVADRVGNHLALVYNRKFISRPPTTTDELVNLAVANTVDTDGDGNPDRYGLVWNFTEPFFAVPFLTGFGASLFDPPDSTQPALNSPPAVAAYKFILSLRDKHRVIPENCDYELADSLFKNGEAAMIMNGDWSWGDYLANERIDAAIAPLPVVTSTGIPMGPMVATKGYSLSVNAAQPQLDAAMELVRYMTSHDVQRRFMAELKTLPSRRALLQDPLLQQDATLMASAQQVRNGRPMPVVAELRAVWDAMRPHYQALLGGSETAEEAAAGMQQDALQKIRLMNQQIDPGLTAHFVRWTMIVALGGVLIWQRKQIARFFRDWRRNRFAYLLVLPAMFFISFTVVFPFCYNVVLSFSNMSLKHFQDWQITGLQSYHEVFTDFDFYRVLLKTIVWTVVNVFFHVTIGLLLAVALNGPLRGKQIYRVLLIIPWAVPAYITALTWRGMFDYKYGAINLMIEQYLHMPIVNWLGSPWEAFSACILTNVWLGFPFMMVIAMGGMQGIPQELYEAARVDRVPRRQQFFHITLPMLKPVLLPAITLGTIWTFNNLNVIWLVSNGGEPSDKTHILVSYVYKAVFNLYRYGYGAALSMVIFFILLAFSLVFLQKTEATKGV